MDTGEITGAQATMIAAGGGIVATFFAAIWRQITGARKSGKAEGEAQGSLVQRVNSLEADMTAAQAEQARLWDGITETNRKIDEVSTEHQKSMQRGFEIVNGRIDQLHGEVSKGFRDLTTTIVNAVKDRA